MGRRRQRRSLLLQHKHREQEQCREGATDGFLAQALKRRQGICACECSSLSGVLTSFRDGRKAE